MPSVDYKSKTISDEEIKTVLGNIATVLDVSVTVTSGDRSSVVQGSNKGSHHIQKRAADFYTSKYTLSEVFEKLKEKRDLIFDPTKYYQVILHGSHTNTGGPHLHVGRYLSRSRTGVKFCKEGMTAETAGRYDCTRMDVTGATKPAAGSFMSRRALDQDCVGPYRRPVGR